MPFSSLDLLSSSPLSFLMIFTENREIRGKKQNEKMGNLDGGSARSVARRGMRAKRKRAAHHADFKQ